MPTNLQFFVVLYKETPNPAEKIMAQGVASEGQEDALRAVVDLLIEQDKKEAIVLGVFAEEDIKSLFLLIQNTKEMAKNHSK